MKNIVLSSVAVAVLVFSGCSTKSPEVQTDSQYGASSQQGMSPEVETVSVEDTMIDSQAGMMDEYSSSQVEERLPVIYFGFDQFDITSEAQAKIVTAAEVGNSVGQNFNVKLEGNCDEWGSDEYNFALGLKRADAVKKALVAEGVDPSRISMVSYGESNPVCTESTSACWAQNRRVNFKILP